MFPGHTVLCHPQRLIHRQQSGALLRPPHVRKLRRHAEDQRTEWFSGMPRGPLPHRFFMKTDVLGRRPHGRTESRKGPGNFIPVGLQGSGEHVPDDYSIGSCGYFATRESVNSGALKCFARLQYGSGKLRLIRRVRKMLRLQAEAVTALVNFAALALEWTPSKKFPV